MPTKLVNKFRKRTAVIPPLPILGEDDAALVTAAASGSNEAFEVLVRRHQARILSAAWRFTRNCEDAEDIVQQSFQKASFTCSSLKGILAFPLG